VSVLLMPARPTTVEAGVVDEDGRPIVGARVSPSRGRRATGDATVTTDEKGRFRLALGNAWQVRIALEGAGTAIASSAGGDVATSAFRFPRRTGLEIRVVEESTGAPLAGVELEVFARGTGGSSSADVPCDGTAVTDAEGRARLPAAPGITPRVMITAAGRRGGFLGADKTGAGPFALGKGSLSTPLSEGELRSIEILMRHSTRVRGRVVSEDGRPMAGARVRVSSQGIGAGLPAPRTGADGRFEILDVFPPSERPLFGAVQPTVVVAVLDGYVDTWAVVARAGSVPEDDVGDLLLVRPRAFAVRVIDPDGRAVKVARVRLRQEDVTTEDDGTAVVTCDGPWTRPGFVAPDGNDDLTVVAPGFAPLVRAVPTASRPGAVVDLGELRLVASLGDPVIVIDASGHPVPGVHVLVAMNFRKGALRDAPTTDADGRVRVQAEDGWDNAHLLTADGVEYDAFLAQGRHPSFPLRVILPAVRPFTGRVLDASGAPVAAAGVRLRPADRSSDRGENGTVARAEEWYAVGTDDGSFRFRAVAAGASELEVRARGCVTIEVEVPDGAPEPFEVRMERFGEKHRRRVAEIETRLAALRSETAEPDSTERGDLERELRHLRGERRRAGSGTGHAPAAARGSWPGAGQRCFAWSVRMAPFAGSVSRRSVMPSPSRSRAASERALPTGIGSNASAPSPSWTTTSVLVADESVRSP